MSKRSPLFASAIAVFAALLFASFFVSAVSAGGFQLSVETPSAKDNETRDAVLLVRTYGCLQPQDANVRGTAEGFVKGERKTINLTLKPTATGVLAVTRQWGSEGSWVLTFTGSHGGMTASVLVDLDSAGNVKPGTRIAAGSKSGVNARMFQRKITDEEIDSALGMRKGGDRKAGEMSVVVWPAAGVTAAASIVGFMWRRRLRGREETAEKDEARS